MTGGKWIHVFILDRNISDIKPHILEGCGEGMRVLHLFMAENVSARMLMSMMWIYGHVTINNIAGQVLHYNITQYSHPLEMVSIIENIDIMYFM